jgi:hypothetical protein
MLAPIIRRNPRAAFALIDPLIGLLAVATVMVGALNFWRLAEYKCDKARIDARVTQILRESSDYAAYLSYDRLPADGAQLRSGFLLHPLDPTARNLQTDLPLQRDSGGYHNKRRHGCRSKRNCLNPHL